MPRMGSGGATGIPSARARPLRAHGTGGGAGARVEGITCRIFLRRPRRPPWKPGHARTGRGMSVALLCVAIAYERLSGLDEAFLAFETPSAYMHVAVTAIFATGPLSVASGGVDLQRVRRHVESRLDRLPRFRQRLAFVPLVRRACWVDDTRFDLAYHVRHASL